MGKVLITYCPLGFLMVEVVTDFAILRTLSTLMPIFALLSNPSSSHSRRRLALLIIRPYVSGMGVESRMWRHFILFAVRRWQLFEVSSFTDRGR